MILKADDMFVMFSAITIVGIGLYLIFKTTISKETVVIDETGIKLSNEILCTWDSIDSYSEVSASGSNGLNIKLKSGRKLWLSAVDKKEESEVEFHNFRTTFIDFGSGHSESFGQKRSKSSLQIFLYVLFAVVFVLLMFKLLIIK